MSVEEELEILYNGCYGGWGMSEKAEELYKSLKGDDDINIYSLSIRTDPVLINLCKEMGKDFNCKYGNVKIIKIPKRYENHYFIHEYDGKETVKIHYALYERDNLLSKIKNILDDDNIDDSKKIHLIRDTFEDWDFKTVI